MTQQPPGDGQGVPRQTPRFSRHRSNLPLPHPCQVSKKLLLLYVQEPEGGADRSSPNALAQVAVHERLVRRWVPESHRLPPPGSK